MTLLGGIGVSMNTSPACVVYQGNLYVFYCGSGNDGIWYTTFDGEYWNQTKKVLDQGIGVAPKTGPCAVSFQEYLYLFWNGAGDDGTFYTVFDGKESKWGPVVSISPQVGGMGFRKGTSPAAAVHDSKLKLFWNGSGNDGIWSSAWNGDSWSGEYNVHDQVPTLAVADHTSPAVVTINGVLYLFWNGVAFQSTFFATMKKDRWDNAASSVAALIGDQGYLPNTSPSTLRFDDDNSGVLVFWTGAGNDGAWFTHFDGKTNWTPQSSMSGIIGGQGLMPMTNVCGTGFGSVAYVFWAGVDYQQTMWFSKTQ